MNSIVKKLISEEITKIFENIIAYHGTDAKFDQFDTNKVGTSTGKEVGGHGLYFTNDYDIAKRYTTTKGRVIKVELKSGRYLNFDESIDDYLISDIENEGTYNGISPESIEQFKSDFSDESYRYDITNKQVYEWLSHVLGSSKNASKYLKTAGYVGIVFNDKTNPDVTNYVMFDPKDVKIIKNDGDEYGLDEIVMEEFMKFNEDYPESFNLDEFKKLRSFAARVKYCNERLTRLGSGSSRVVYKIDEQKALKLAKNPKGQAQNSTEASIGVDNYFSDIVARVYDSEENDLWIESELAKKLTKSRFKQIVGYDVSWVYHFIRRRLENYKFDIDPQLKEKIDEDQFMNDITELASSYNLEAGDLGRISSYGEVNRNGTPQVVVVDYGFDEDVRQDYYS